MGVQSPTKSALTKHKCAVVMLTADARKPEHVVHDFEWFDRTSQSDLFIAEMNDIYNEECEDGSGLYYLLASVDDTTTMSVKEIRVIHPKGDEPKAFCTEWAAKVAADPMLLVFSPKKKSANVENAVVKVEKKAPATVKGRKPSAAAAAADGAKTTAPAPRGAARKAVVAKADPKAEPAKAAPTPSALKSRLAAKKAEAAKTTAAPKAETPKTADAAVNALVPMGLLIRSNARMARNAR